MKRIKTLNPNIEETMVSLIQSWRRYTKLNGPDDVLQTREFRRVVSSIETLKKDFEDAGASKAPLTDPDLLGAYLLYYWPMHFLEGLSILAELPVVPNRVLDIGSAPCPLPYAAHLYGAREIYATDKNEVALRLGADVCGRLGMPLTIRKWDVGNDRCPIEGSFDLITIGHCLEELIPRTGDWEKKQNEFIKQQLDRLNPHGFLILIDSSLPKMNERILKLRDSLVADGVPVQAPCVWQGKCPALLKSAPCYAQRIYDKPYVMKEIQRAANINLSSLKMSYLILKSPKASWPNLPPIPMHRVISPPFDTPQGQTFYLCGTDGKKRLTSRLEQLPPGAKAFKYLRRGELISIHDAHEYHGGYDLEPDSEIHIEAACGKPIPEVF